MGCATDGISAVKVNMEEDEFAVKWYRTTQIQRSFLLKNDESYLNKRIILIYTFFILHIKILEWCYTYVCKIPVKHGHTQNKWEKMRNKRGLCRLEQRQQYDPVRMCWCEKNKFNTLLQKSLQIIQFMTLSALSVTIILPSLISSFPSHSAWRWHHSPPL